MDSQQFPLHPSEESSTMVIPNDTSIQVPLPQEALHETKGILYESIENRAGIHPYAFQIQRSLQISHARIIYSCDRADNTPPAEHPSNRTLPRKRKTLFQKAGYEFPVIAYK